jgi:hypothetical protein
MHRPVARRAVRLMAFVAGAVATLAPSGARAQRGPAREAIVHFGREYDTGDGYASARVTIRYQLADCVGDVAVLYAMDRESMWTASTYYYGGKSYEVPASIGAPRPSTVVFQGPILDAVGRFQGSFSDPYTQGGAGSGCIGQSKVVFSRKEKLGPRSTPEQYEAYLQQLWIQPTTQPRLRDGRVESWIGQQLARSREDSLARVAAHDKRNRDAKALRDSLDRADRALADRRRREADSTRAANDRRADDDRSRDDQADRDRQREQEVEDREAQRQRDQNASDQTTRLNAMFAHEKIVWERAEEAYARGDMATARPLYEELTGSLVYAKMAQDRLNTLNSQQVAEGVVATLSLMNDLRKALSNALHGTNLAVGAAYAQNGFPGAKGDAGITFSYVSRPMQRWVPYFDFTFGLGNDESQAERYYPNKSYGGVVAGTTVPRLKLALGNKASLAPHFGYRWMVTDLRDVHVGQTGLMLVVPGAVLRGDAVIINGKPQLGGAISRIF